MIRKLDDNLDPIYKKNMQICPLPKGCGKPFDKQYDFLYCPACLIKMGVMEKRVVVYDTDL
jgi:hypothetical protein